jgi:3-oxoacyl-[acyl-carrier protein] reductase
MMAPAPSSLGSSDLSDKVAVVTGASRGIGAATAAELARHGARVACVARDHRGLEAVVQQIRNAGGTATAVPADCTSETELRRARDSVTTTYGPTDILIAFAGGYGTPVRSINESAAHWREVIDGDLSSVFITISAFLPDLLDRRGAIVTMASESARHTTAASAAYAAAKGGVIALTRHLGGELAPSGVRINCVSPSTIETEMLRARVPDERRAAMGAAYPLGRLGLPTDVSALARFLVSTEASWITGETFDLSGGRTVL